MSKQLPGADDKVKGKASTQHNISRQDRESSASPSHVPDADIPVSNPVSNPVSDLASSISNQPSDKRRDQTLLNQFAPDITFVATLDRSFTTRGNSDAGRRLKNRFVLEQKVGSGGMGDVYKTLDLRQQEAQADNPYIAIKILNDHFSRHKDAFISLQREATRTRGIRHPNIMAVYDFDREGDTIFMSMELLDGRPLDDYLREHPEGVSTDDAWNIIDGICKGLGRAHEAGIVHSDFKPGNIYYTANKTAKVFDFGISRAEKTPLEQSSDQKNSSDQKPGYDAGVLRALTPTYASYEMLKGFEPAKSDDIYAVALIVYELFTGRHPFDRLPADEVLAQGLRPKPIEFLNRRQWKTLQKGLEIRAKKRVQSLAEFHEGMFSEDPPYLRYGILAVVLAATLGVLAYQQFYPVRSDLPIAVEYHQDDFLRLESLLVERLAKPNFDAADWHRQVERKLANIRGLRLQLSANYSEFLAPDWLRNASVTIQSLQDEILTIYSNKIEGLQMLASQIRVDEPDPAVYVLAIVQLIEAQRYIDLVKSKYNFDVEAINSMEVRLITLLSTRRTQLDMLNRALEEAASARADRRLIDERRQREVRLDIARYRKHDQNLVLFSTILTCPGGLTSTELSRLGVVLSDLQSGFPARYAVDYPGIETALAGCIQRIAVRAPDRAFSIRDEIATFLPGSLVIRHLVIQDQDNCARSELVGQGIRNGSWCADDLVAGGKGPQLVVIPAKPGIALEASLGRAFATGRMEVKIGEFNAYCADAGCSHLSGDVSLPVTNVSLEQAESYVRWLSHQSGKAYRLPTSDEWIYAASGDDVTGVHASVNCRNSIRGARRRGRLRNSLSGMPNHWGLYNPMGNAREWVVDEGQVHARGGAYSDLKSQCRATALVAHSGEADLATGFRVVREI